MATCPGKRVKNNNPCNSSLYRCKKCGNVGCEQGDSSQCSNQGFRYYAVFVDEFSRFSWFYPMKYKSDFFSTFVTFKT